MANDLHHLTPIMRGICGLILLFGLSLSACSQGSDSSGGTIIPNDPAPAVEDSSGDGTASPSGAGDDGGTASGAASAASNNGATQDGGSKPSLLLLID